MPPPALARNDRVVHRCRLALRAGEPVQRIVTSLEDALRLCTLPGESTGRMYYFRRLRLSGVPADRRRFQQAVESTLQAEAARAVHGARPDARYANAVYFHNAEDACASLLAVAGQPSHNDDWFWPSVSGSLPAASPAERVADAVETLSRTQASWLAVASAVFSLREPLAVLRLVAESRACQWLAAMQSQPSSRIASQPVVMREELREHLREAAAAFVADDARACFLATLAVVLTLPAEMDGGHPVSRARATLHAISHVAPTHHAVEPASTGAPASAPHHRYEAQQPARERPKELGNSALRHSFGDRSDAAGLFFLLNVLGHLRLSAQRRNPLFVARFLLLAAHCAGVDANDPALQWARDADALHPASPRDGPVQARLLRRVQRWCWHHAALGVRNTVMRTGYLTLTPTHLDMTLPLDTADVRIRRAGLDLDPGWLPWFGRVVHFHYKDRGELA